MSKTYSNRGFTVTVNDDRSIDVKPNDYISKFAAAIYNDPLANWDRFKQKQGQTYLPLDNPNSIKVGTKVYHPGPLPGEIVNVDFPAAPIGGDPTAPDVAQSTFIEWLNYLACLMNPVTDWTLVGSGGLELNGAIFCGHYVTVGVKRTIDPVPTWYHGAGIGAAIGVESLGSSVAIAFPHFWSVGTILKAPGAGLRLSKLEISGSYAVVDFGAGIFMGGSVSALMFGFHDPAHFVLRNICRLISGDPRLGLRDMLTPKGLMIMAGGNMSTPNLGISMKVGWMNHS